MLAAMTKRYSHIALFVIGFLPLWLAAQQPEHDLQARIGMQLKQDLPKGFDLGLTYQLRLDHNLQAFSGSYLSVDGGYKLHKHLSALADFRYATSYDWDKFRFGAGLVWKDKLMKKTDYSIKLRYQREVFLQSWPEIGQFPTRNNIRLKLEVERKLAKRFYLHVSCEPQVRYEGRIGGFQRLRNVAGFDWEFVKHHHIDLSYFYQPEFELGQHRESKYMLVAMYTVDLGKWWKGKKDDKDKDQGKD
jgi:Protein of unknown function (DUF2490)